MRNQDESRIIKAVTFIIGASIVVYISYFLSGCFNQGSDINGIYKALQNNLRNPLGNYWNESTPYFMLAGTMVFIIVQFGIKLNKGNYMNGKEYGTMKYISPKSLSKKLEDKNKKRHSEKIMPVFINRKIQILNNIFGPRIKWINTNQRRLSERLSFSLNTRQHGLNDNVLVTGGSGSGKTYYVAKPNLLNMTGSYIVTDPKGGAQRSVVKSNGTVCAEL